MKESTEDTLKTAAKLYAEKEGESLMAEDNKLREQNVSYMTPRADETVRKLATKGRAPGRRKIVFGLVAAAACIVIAVRLVTGVAGPAGSLTPSSEGPSSSSHAGPTGILPISFTLPADYRVKTSELDNGVSVYKLESGHGGDVVLTMYYTDDTAGGLAGPGAGFDKVVIDGTPVPAKVTDAYRLLVFESDGLSYTLSSKDDLGALAAFYRNITEGLPA